MITLAAILERFRTNPSTKHANNPFRLVSSVSAPATPAEVASAWKDLPPDLSILWSECRDARLFEDIDYGQWGLVVLDPVSSASRTTIERAARPADLREDDIVVGMFLGDQELLIFAPSEHRRRRILVALPLDSRGNWFGAASSLGEFLDSYFNAGGNKFWEDTRRIF